MAYSEKLLTEGEEIVREFRPHWRLLAIPVLWTVFAIVLIVLAWTIVPPDNSVADLITTGVIVVLLFPLAVMPFVRWWFTSYVLTNERLVTRSGVIARSGIEIPLENINNVIFSQTVLERLLRSGDLLIESAGETGQSRFADIPEPEAFQALLYRVREARAQALSGAGQAPAQAAAEPTDPAAKLERLARLREQGLVTEEEFEEKRRKLVDEI